MAEDGGSTKHCIVFSNLIAIIALMVKAHRQSAGEVMKKPVVVKPRAGSRKKGERQSRSSMKRAALLILGLYS